MTRSAREALALAVATAIGESSLVMLMTGAWSAFATVTVLLLTGPLIFLAVAVWRRRMHLGHSRVLFIVTALCAVGGLSVLGSDLYRYYNDAAFRLEPNMRPIIVPLVQWAIILVVWVWLVIQEAREKRAKQNQQPTPPRAIQ